MTGRSAPDQALHVAVCQCSALHVACCSRLAFPRASDLKEKVHEQAGKTEITLSYIT